MTKGFSRILGRFGYWPLVMGHGSFLSLALCLAGCATSQSSGPTTTLLQATGDPGVTVRVQCTEPGVPEQVATVPAELSFTGGSYKLRCIHGPQPGKLRLIARHRGISISTGDTLRPGEVTVFKIRPNEISVAPESAAK